MANKPRIRFKGFTKDWEQRKLGEFVKIVSGDAPSTFISGNCIYVKVDDLNYSDRIQLSSSNLVNANPKAHLVNQGATIFPKRGAAIMTNKVRIMGQDGYLDTNMMALIPEEIDKDFLFTFIQKTGLYKIADTSTIPQINNKHIEPYMIQVPSEKEQAYIGVVFEKIDKIITLHQCKLEKLKLTKKALLQKLFPKNGKHMPEIRFKGFTDAWEQRKLGEFVKIVSGDAPSTFISGNCIYVKVDDLNYSDRIQLSSSNLVNANPKAHLVNQGATIFPKRGAAIMTNKVRIMGQDGYLDTNMMALIPEEIDKDFLFTFIQKTGLYKIADTSTIPQINNKHIEPYMIQVPSEKEQAYIGVVFEKIDKIITLHQRKLERLQEVKKGLLQKMFV